MLKRFLPPKLVQLAEEQSATSQSSHTEFFIVLGAVLLIMALLIFWAVYIRKPKHRSSRALNVPGKIQRSPRDGERRKRRRRWKNRNPTLSQTGGLPPARNDDASPL